MKRFITIILVVMVIPAAFSRPAAARAAGTGDKTLSPYFLVQSDDPGVDRLPLKSTSADVLISGVIADVTVTQVYENRGQRTLEAMYVFPACTRAAVYGMKMTIGERTIIAKIDRREAARRQYEQAKQEGRSASLLEQQRPNVFQMNVANILPGDVIRVELRYTELLVPEDHVYSFVYPTVVGPRYTGGGADDSGSTDAWTANPYLHEGEPPTYAFHMDVRLSAGLPIQDVSCASHRVNVRYEGPSRARLSLDPLETGGGNRDVIVKYRLAGGKIQTGLLLFEGEKENFFLLMMQPPERVETRQIPPREYIFIVDVSGSMHGFPLEVSKKLLKDLIGNLRPGDRFNVLLFAGGSTLMSERSLSATRTNVTRALNVIDRQRGGGGTRLLPALKQALALPRMEGFSRSIVIATDGYVSVEEAAFDLIRKNLGEANMFAFGVGSSVNRHLIEGMARVGMGEPFVVTRPEEGPGAAAKFRELIQSPVLTDVKVDFKGFDTYEVEPPSIPDILARRPVLVFGKWKGEPVGAIRLSGTGGEGAYRKELRVADYIPASENRALPYLWARHRIALLSDYNRLRSGDKRIEAVTLLGLRYNLLTAYTSFVAVDSLKRLDDGRAVSVKQPLPLPQGVSDYAVGGRCGVLKTGPAAPTPHSRTRLEGMMTGAVREKKERDATLEPAAAEETEASMLKLVSMSCSGGLSEDGVRAVVERELKALNRCRQQGRLTFKLTIDSNGKVVDAFQIKGPRKTDATIRCMIRILKTLRFSELQNVTEAEVILEFSRG